MRRSTVRSCLIVALLLGAMGMGPWGCIPSFRGMKPVTKAELAPKAKPKDAAEYLFWKEYRKVWFGQVGQFPTMTFRRVYTRIRINSEKGLKAATMTIRSGRYNKPLAFRARATCPDGRTVTVKLGDIPDISKKTRYFPFVRWSDRGSIKVSASGATVGCVVDFYWEEDLPGTVISAVGTSIFLMKEFPTRNAHIRLNYDNLKSVRPSLLSMAGLWAMIQRKRLAAMMAKKAAKKGEGKKPSGLMLTQKEKEKYVKLVFDNKSRQIDLYLNDIPGVSRRKRMMLAKTAKAMMLPGYYLRPPMLYINTTRTYGIQGEDFAVAWRDIDKAYTKKRSWNQDDRSMIQRSYQIDEEEELKDKGLAAIARKVVGSASKRIQKVKLIHDHLRKRMLVTKLGTYSGMKLDKLYLLGRGTTYEINMMMVVMLRSVGVRAYPALLVPGNRVFQSLPPNPLFRSAVVYVPAASEGKWKGLCKERDAARKFLDQKGDAYQGGRESKTGFVYDVANKYLPFGYVAEKHTGVDFFVIDGAGGRFFNIGSPNPLRNKIKRTYKLQVRPDGSVKGTIEVAAWGNQASKLRWQFHKVNKSLWEKKRVGLTYGGRCAAQAQARLVKAPAMSGKVLQEPFSYTYEVDTASCIVHGKHGFLLGADTGILLPMLKGPIRLHPIALGTPRVLERTFVMTFPKGYRPIVKARNISASAPGGISTTLKVGASGNVLTFDLKHQHTQRWLAPKAYGKIKAFFKNFAFTKDWQIQVKR